jgi:NADH:ubiquinone oxidoreductase subunit 5 (subunit L)/multisubunit Na+/H+ antiporter MnhA subunit
MPLTAAAFLIGSVAIVGLPPLNGFVSEWVVFQAVLRSGTHTGPTQFVVFAGAGLALIAALAVACFARVAGVVFLGQPRVEQPAQRSETAAGMLVPMIALAAACCVLGAAPFIAMAPVSRVVAQLMPTSAGGTGLADAGLVAGTLGVAGLAAALLGGVAVIGVLRAAAARGRTPATAATWSCAYPQPSTRMQYTASSFGAPILSAFGSLAKPAVRRTSDSFATTAKDPVLASIVAPLWVRIQAAAAALRSLQQGRLTTYLQYVVATVIVLLGLLFVSGRGP